MNRIPYILGIFLKLFIKRTVKWASVDKTTETQEIIVVDIHVSLGYNTMNVKEIWNVQIGIGEVY